MVPNPADTLQFDVLTSEQSGFPEACTQVASLFAKREAEFHFNPEIDRPAIAVPGFLADPEAALLPIIAGDKPVTILTTWSDTLVPILIERGFQFRPIHWPAGPVNSGIFTRAGYGRHSYIELVNEEAPEIAPSHVLIVRDGQGIAGGTISSLRENAAWLTVMCVRAGMPGGTGTQVWNALVADLAGRGIARLDLGTQTAEQFYARCGMAVADRVIERLRWRSAPEGPVWNDLVMMTVDI